MIVPNVCLIQHGKMTDMETIAFDRIVFYLQFPSGEGIAHHTGPHREAPGWPGGRWREGRAWSRACIVVPTGRNGRGTPGRFEQTQDCIA